MGILVITGAQRSGTTALQTALSSTGRFNNFSEVFHTTNSISGATFLDFVKINGFALDSMVTDDQAMAIANSYIDFLIERTPANQHTLIDIKFNSWNVIRGWWCYIFSEPLFMRALKNRNADFILLRRRDLLDQVLSNRIAAKANKWHNLTQADKPEPFEVDLPTLQATAETILRAENSIVGFLSPYRRTQLEWYEELFDNNIIRPKLRQYLSERFSIDVNDFAPSPIRKNDLKKESIITNYAQARVLVEGVIANLGSNRTNQG